MWAPDIKTGFYYGRLAGSLGNGAGGNVQNSRHASGATATAHIHMYISIYRRGCVGTKAPAGTIVSLEPKTVSVVCICVHTYILMFIRVCLHVSGWVSSSWDCENASEADMTSGDRGYLSDLL